MVPPATPSRRALLAGVGAGIAAGLAGCSGSDTSRSTPDAGTLVTDYSVATARSGSDQPPILAPSAAADGTGTADEASPTPEAAAIHTVASESDAEELVVAEDATNSAAVRRLLAETTYSKESVLVHQRRIPECYRLQVNYVTRDADGSPDVQLCRVVRDADVDCERDAEDFVAVAVRLPFPADGYSSLSVGVGGNCDPIPEQYRNESDSA